MSHDISWHFHFCVRMDYGEICLSVIFDTTEKVRGWLQGRIGLHSHPEYVSSRWFTQTRFNPLSVFTTARAYWHRKFVTRFDPHTWKQTRWLLVNLKYAIFGQTSFPVRVEAMLKIPKVHHIWKHRKRNSARSEMGTIPHSSTFAK